MPVSHNDWSLAPLLHVLVPEFHVPPVGANAHEASVVMPVSSSSSELRQPFAAKPSL
jgi:hypothetical protein